MQKIKEKLFGITVAASLAIIFVPMILTGQQNQKLSLTHTTPKQPNIQSPVGRAQLAEWQDTLNKAEPARLTEKQAALTASSEVVAKSPPLEQAVKNATQPEKVARIETQTQKATKTQSVKAIKQNAPERKAALAVSSATTTAGGLAIAKAPTKQDSAEPFPGMAPEQALFLSNSFQPVTEMSPTAIQAHEAQIVQLATFGNSKNASQLLTTLQKDGYTAYTKVAPNNMTVVYVRPSMDNQQTAMQLSEELKGRYQLKGRVIAQ